jgi:hypothetical protein
MQKWRVASDSHTLRCASTSRRLRAGTSLSKFATQANAKAELNRRSQVCEALAGTGIRVAEKNPKRTESGLRPLLRPCGVSAGRPDSLGKWTGMSVARRLFRFGRPACVSQHLCPEKNPVLELHQPLRLCRPPPELFGRRDRVVIQRFSALHPIVERSRKNQYRTCDSEALDT